MRKKFQFIVLGVFLSIQSYLSFAIELAPHLDFSFKISAKRHINRMGGLFPLYETEKSVSFLNLFGLWDSQGAKEGNLGLGYRQTSGTHIIGVNGFLDRRMSANGLYHSQFTLGFEWLGAFLEGRINGYVPFSKKKTKSILVSSSPINYGQVLGFEKGLGGLDMEIGGLLFRGNFSNHIGYYHFNGKGVKAVSGVRFRSGLGLNDFVSLETEYSYDNQRHFQYFIGFKLSSYKKHHRITQMVVRDIDIITGFESRRNAPISQDSLTQNDAIDLSRFALLPNGMKSLHLNRQGIFSYEDNQGKRYELTDTVGANKAHIIKLQPENWLKHHYLKIVPLVGKNCGFKLSAFGRMLGGSGKGKEPVEEPFEASELIQKTIDPLSEVKNMSEQTLVINEATIEDVPLILTFIKELAAFEKLLHEVTATEEILRETLFGARPKAEVVIAYLKEVPVGFALYFHNFSTFLGKPGLYLEDLYVKPDVRGKGIGKKLLQYLAKLALKRDCGRFEWWVLNWNHGAIDFYRKIGAVGMDEWTVQRVTDDALIKLANGD